MKYIKTYESRKIGKYWLIPTDYRIERVFSIIKVPKLIRDNIKLLLYKLEKEDNMPKYMYLGQKFNDKSEWSWIKANPLYLDEKNNIFENDNFIFKGSILMDETDTITNKFNL